MIDDEPGCNANDMALVNAAGGGRSKDEKSVPGVLNKCGRKAYNFWRNSFSQDKFYTCAQDGVLNGLSKKCTKCLGIGPSYGAQNCKGACMSNSCAPKCDKCTKPSGAQIVACAGFETPKMD